MPDDETLADDPGDESQPRDAISASNGATPNSETQQDRPRATRSQADAPPTMPGIPGYEIVQELSRGGQAIVFEARQISTGQRVAVKVIHFGPFASSRQRARLDREVQVLASLQHPNIVSILDKGVTADGSDFFVMRFIHGVSLDTWLSRRAAQADQWKPPSERVLGMFQKVCEAIDVAHRAGIVHRDIKPSNIRVDANGEPYVLDFGLAHTRLDGASTDAEGQPLTITGQFLGSLPWASPEQADGDPEAISARTDVYALGVILYQMVTGEFPYEVAGKMRDVLDNIMRVEPTPPSEIIAARYAKQQQDARKWRLQHGGGISEDLEAIVLKALSKEPDERYATAGDLAADVRRYLAGKPSVAAAISVKERRQMVTGERQASGTNVVLLSACISALIVLVGLGVWALTTWSTPPTPAPAPIVVTPPAPTPTKPDGPTEPAGPTKPDTPPPGSERAAALRMFDLGAAVSVRTPDGSGGKASKFDQLPDEPYRIVAVHLSNNTRVTDDDLIYLKDTPDLALVYMMNTRIGDAGLAHLKGLKNVSLLDLRSTRVTGAGLEYVAGFEQLRSIELLGCAITDDSLAHLSSLHGLGSIRLSGGGVTDEGLIHLKDLNLRDLLLRGCLITDEGIKTVAGFKQMSFLDLYGTGVTDDGLALLADLPSLSYLTLDSCSITDKGMDHIAKMRGLKQISLAGCAITDAGLEKLHGLKMLRHVGLYHTRVTSEGIKKFKEAIPTSTPTK